MPDARRRPFVIAAAVLAVGAVTLSTPSVAGGLFDAHNAEKVAGLKPTDLTKTQLFTAAKRFDGFDTCAMSTVMKRKFTAPHGGVMTVQAQIGSARDSSSVGEGLLVARILVDGAVASHEVGTNLENDGVQDAALSVFGGRKVTMGKHTIKLQAEECGDGAAYIVSQTMLVSFSPFGDVTGAYFSKAKGNGN